MKHVDLDPSKSYAARPFQIRSLIDLVSSPFARHYSGNDYYFLFLRLLRCFSSPGLLAPTKSQSSPRVQRGGFPHSDICGSKVACHLTAAYRRLLRPSSLSYVKASTIYSCWDSPTLLFPKVCSLRKMKWDLTQNNCKVPRQVIFWCFDIILKIFSW